MYGKSRHHFQEILNQTINHHLQKIFIFLGKKIFHKSYNLSTSAYQKRNRFSLHKIIVINKGK